MLLSCGVVPLREIMHMLYFSKFPFVSVTKPSRRCLGSFEVLSFFLLSGGDDDNLSSIVSARTGSAPLFSS